MIEFDAFAYSRLINSISKKIYEGFKLEFIGVLEDFDMFEDKKSIAFLEYLIKCKIYLEVKEIPQHAYCPAINEIMDSPNDNLEYLDGFIYEDKCYLYNFKIYSEIYKITEYVIKNRLSFYIEKDMASLISELNGVINNKEKIKLLKKKLKLYWQPFQDSGSFLLFMDQKQEWPGQTWEDEIRGYLVEDDIFTLFYLTCSKKENLEESHYYKTTFKLWVEHFRKKRLIDFCKIEIEKINRLPVVPKNAIKKPKAPEATIDKIKLEMICKAEYISLFQYIVTSYSDKKNRAFYSYLFRYFSEKKYLLKNIKSSVPYSRFLVENDYIDTFSKVIQRTSDNSDEEKKMIDIFDEFNLKFIQKKLKEN